MSENPHDMIAAQARIDAARARFSATLGEVQARLQPSHLAQDMVESAAHGVASVARKGADAVKSRPFAAAGFAATLGLVLARGWIADILHKRHETREPETGLKPQGKKGSS